MSCAETDELIEMSFGVWTGRLRLAQGTTVPPEKRHIGGTPCNAVFRHNSLTTCLLGQHLVKRHEMNANREISSSGMSRRHLKRRENYVDTRSAVSQQQQQQQPHCATSRRYRRRRRRVFISVMRRTKRHDERVNQRRRHRVYIAHRPPCPPAQYRTFPSLTSAPEPIPTPVHARIVPYFSEF